MIAYVALGILAGLVSLISALVLGASIWFSLLLYCLVGAASVLLAAWIHFIVGERQARGTQNRQEMPVPDIAGSPDPVRVSPDTHWAHGRMRILAVDDDPIILGLIPRIAAEVGCPDTTMASSGAQALGLLEQSAIPYDCLLLDINMPEMDGIELCGRIRSMSAYRETPIIMLTAMKDVDHLDRAFRAGASDYTSKPFDVIEFGARLQKVQGQILARQAEAASGAAAAKAEGNAGWIVPALGSFGGLAALIDHTAFQNYIVRLAGPTLSGAYVMAVSVEQDSRTTSAGASVVLESVAVAIDTVFAEQPLVMSYAGDGQFVLVSHSAKLPDPLALERAIEDQLHQPEGIVVSVGMAVRPDRSKTQRAQIVLDRAIALSKDRSFDKKGGRRSGHA